MVGAVDNNGEEASFSQGGYLVDVWAPGVDILVRLSAVWPATCNFNSPKSFHTSSLAFEDAVLTQALKCAYGSGDGTRRRSGTSVAAPAVAGLAAILIVAARLQTAEQVKETILGLAHSRNGGPEAIYIGNPGDYCQTRRKRTTRWDRRTDEEDGDAEACASELLSTTATLTETPKSIFSSVTRSTSIRSSSLAKSSSSSSVPLHISTRKTSSAPAAVETINKSSCDDRAWYDDEDECDAKCFPEACAEVTDGFSNAFPSFVCEC